MEMRINYLTSLKVQGLSRDNLRNEIREKWGVESRAQQNKYLKWVDELLLAEAPNADELRALNNERLDYVYEKTIQAEKFGDALRAVDLINKTNGIYVEKKEIKVESDIEFEVSFGDGNKG